jgi:hypothetical protein
MRDAAESRAVEDEVRHPDCTALERRDLTKHPGQRRLPGAVASDELDDHRISRYTFS